MAFHLNRSGAARFLGQREADIMEILWDDSPLSGKDIHFRLRIKQKLALTTVLTLLTRLVEKGHAIRTRPHKVHHYSAALTKTGFLEQRVGEIIRALKKDYPALFKKAEAKRKK